MMKRVGQFAESERLILPTFVYHRMAGSICF